MATQKVKPDPEVLDRHDHRQRRRTFWWVGAYGLVALVIAVITVAALALRDGGETPVTETATETVEPTASPPPTDLLLDPDQRPDGAVGFAGLPPEGTAPSKPVHGKLIMQDGDFRPLSFAVNVYADGRVISRYERYALDPIGTTLNSHRMPLTGWMEQRLNPEGVELVRAGEPLSSLPASAWKEPRFEPFVPSRYAVCPTAAFRLLPREALDILRGSPLNQIRDCYVVTTEEARTLDAILVDEGFRWVNRRHRDGGIEYRYESGSPDPHGVDVEIDALLPSGAITGDCCSG